MLQRYKKSVKSKTEQFQNLRHPDRTGQKICEIQDRTGLKSVHICEICGKKGKAAKKKSASSAKSA
jgi:hypothetical protein